MIFVRIKLLIIQIVRDEISEPSLFRRCNFLLEFGIIWINCIDPSPSVFLLSNTNLVLFGFRIF